MNNLTNDDFSVRDLAQKVRLSRSQLHRRLKANTGLSASCFIRETRLIRASELLLANNKTISEIAYMVGFGSPSYFNKCFHDYFGYSPGEFKKQPKAAQSKSFFKTSYNCKEFRTNKYIPFPFLVLFMVIIIVLILLFLSLF
ncbi:helix-turn-helix domain-containing protein [uncultured Draconibacterium sp.]|uniref:helix-turn-helix domain-containing protein n=1 Tax=uncultured Draconibacterium sp. TaxID=1573823 RepID=UPI003749AC12